MKHYFLLLICISITITTQAQTTGMTGCAFDGRHFEPCSNFGFGDREEAIKVVEQMLEYVGVPRNFEVMECPGVNNCMAVKFAQVPMPYLIYDNQFLNRISASGFTNAQLPKNQVDWSSLTIMAHEIGHLVALHLFQKGGSRPDLEIQADEFAGKIIYHLGGSLADAQKVYRSSMISENGNGTHPARYLRLAAVKRGYEKAGRLFPRSEVNRPLPPPAPKPTPHPRDLAPEGMVYVEGGTFLMGCDDGRDGDCQNDEKPLHQVTVDDFYMSKYEVTNEEFCQFLNAKGNQKEGGVAWIELEKSQIEEKGDFFLPKQGYEKHPVIYVSWYGVNAYAIYRGMRLPTEAEWEFAARGGKSSRRYKYSGRNVLEWIGWHNKNSDFNTHQVGEKFSNELELYDMSGNVWEWCSDWYEENSYDNSISLNPKGALNGNLRVIRGGSWNFDSEGLRVANRYYGSPDNCYDDVGFRLASSLSIFLPRL